MSAMDYLKNVERAASDLGNRKERERVLDDLLDTIFASKLTSNLDQANASPASLTLVNLEQEWDVQYWSQRFGCTPDQLRAAVNKVGRNPTDVETELRMEIH
jgi:hypothetical protein